MARLQFAALALLALLALAATTGVQATFGDSYCEDSAFDSKMIGASDYYRQRGLFQEAYGQFRSWTRNANLTSTTDLQSIANQLKDLAATYAAQYDAATQGFTVTRSSGIIIIDTASANMVNPELENHNTRYEYAKAIQCRDHGAPVVFEKYFVPRLQKTFHFFAKAIQTGIDGTWFVFRVNFF
jgi:hypothetical protein